MTVVQERSPVDDHPRLESPGEIPPPPSRRRVYWDTIRGGITFAPLHLYNLFLWAALDDRRRFFELDEIEGLEELTAHWADIRRELDDLQESGPPVPRLMDVDLNAVRLAGDGKWSTFFFRIYGSDVPINRGVCPKTSALVDHVPGVFTAMFSIISPGKRIPRHFGQYKGVLRYHLAVTVPDGHRSGIKVGHEVHQWEDGQALLFDDNFFHEAWNYGDEDRVVLFLDIARPMPWQWLDRFNRRLMDFLSRTNRVQTAVENAKALRPSSGEVAPGLT